MRAPAVVGAKATVMVQVPPTARAVVVEQVFTSEKEVGLVPVIEIPLILRTAVPELVRVTV